MRSVHLLTAALILVGATAAHAGGTWIEDFGHNNAALYTNLNGAPNNLTITEGIARFDGGGGAYYGRPELGYQNVLDAEREVGSGVVGIGWYDPFEDFGMSVLIDPSGQPSMSLLEHNGLTSPTVLGSVPIELGTTSERIVFAFVPAKGKGNNASWYAAWFINGSGFAQATMNPTTKTGVGGHFMMYGRSAAGIGPGGLDYVAAYVPEPASLVMLLLGAGYVALRRRNRANR